MRITWLLFMLSLTVNTAAFAFFCPTNFSQIEFGMTTEEVTKICGKPTTQKETNKENENVPQEWNYYISQTVSTGGNYQTAQGTLKSSVVFNAEGKAINISVNGIGVGASQICGKPIKLGDSRDDVKAACGTPAFVTKQGQTANGPKEDKITEFVYATSTPPMTLIFTNGILTAKK